MAIVFSQVSGTGRFCCLKKNWLSFSGVWPCPTVTPQDRGQEPPEWRRWWWRTPPVQGRLLGGWREEVLWPPGVILCFSPQGRAAEPSAPLQASTYPWRSEDEGFRPHDPVPGVLGGGQALCTPASQRQHDYGERQDQHHGTPSQRRAPDGSSARQTLAPQTEGVSCQNQSGL